MRRKQRNFAKLLAFLLLFQCLGFGTTYADEKVLEMNFIAKADFDKGKLTAEQGKIAGSNITVAQGIGERSGGVLQANATMTAAHYTVTTDNPQKHEATLISFDLRADTVSTRGYMHVIPKSLENDETKYRALYFMDTGKIGFFSDFMGAGVGTGMTAYSANQWYHFDMWFDYANLMVYYFIDGQELFNVPLTEDFDGVAGFKFVVEMRNGGGTYLFDNIQIVDFPERGGKIALEGVTALERLTLPVALEYETAENQLGFNFTSKAVEFVQTLTNVTNEERAVKVDTVIINDEGQNVASDTYNVDLATREKIKKKVNFKLLKYGFYKIHTTVYDTKDNSQISTSEFRFAVLHVPEEGIVNPKMGFNDHTASMGHGIDEFDRKFELLSDSGAGIFRSGHDAKTATLGPEKNYALNDTYTNYNQIIEQNGARPFVLLTREGGKYPPVTPAEYKEWSTYVESIAKQFKGRNPIYEVWNEYNIPSFNYNNATVENYVAMLKNAYEVIKKVDPDAIVCGFASAPALKPAYELSAQDWMKLVLDAGGGNYMDMASLHLYTNNIPEDFSSERGKLIADTRKMLDEHGFEHIKIMTSEMGWSTGSSVDDVAQAQYMVRYAALTNDKLEYTTWYVDQDKQTTSASENGYGFIRAWTKAYCQGGEPYSAKPALLAFSNWNALMTGAFTEKEIEQEDNETHIYQFSLPNHKRALLLWNETGNKKAVSLKLDADKLEMYDIYGNQTDLTGLNGEFTVDYSGSMVYLIGEFNAAEVCDSKFVNLTNEFAVALNDTASVVFKNNSSIETELVFGLPENITEVKRTKDMVTLAAGSNPQEGEKIHISVCDKETGAIYYKYEIPVVYKDDVTYSLDSSYFRNGRWQCVLELKNNTSSKTVSGKVKIKEPTDAAAIADNFKFDNLLPQDKKYIRINMPSVYTGKNTDVLIDIALDDGTVLENLSNSVHMTAFAPMPSPPKIDGVLDEGEWNKAMPMLLNSRDQIKGLPNWGGTDDLSGKMYCAYDKDNFYLAAEVTDDALGAEDEKERIWYCDSIQFSFAKDNKKGMPVTQYGIGILNGKPRMERYSFMGVDTGMIGMIDTKTYEGTELQITRKDNLTIYEAKFPWEQIYGEKIDVGKMSEAYFSIIINENDGAGRIGALEYAGGIYSGSDASQFIPVKLEK